MDDSIEAHDSQPPRQRAWRKAQSKRRDKLTVAAQALGFETIDKLATAIIELTSEVKEEIRKRIHGQ